MMPAISWRPIRGATWLRVSALAAVWACGARKPAATETGTGPTATRVLPLTRIFGLETSGPTPSDTSVSFPAGTRRTIFLRHGPPENIVFARLTFEGDAFADSGQTVQVDVHPRPGVYGLDIATSQPLRPNRAAVVFEYSRYFSAPARARQVHGSDVAFERVLAVGRLLPDNRIELLPSTRPAADNLRAAIPAPGSYIVAGPQ